VELYNKKGINQHTNIGKLKAEDYPIFDDLFALIKDKLKTVKDEFYRNNLLVLETYIQKFATGGRNSDLWNGPTSILTDENLITFNFQTLFASKNNKLANAQMLLVLKYLNNEVINNKKFNADEAFKLMGMALFLGTVFNKFIVIRESNLMLLVYLFLITIITDSYAQFGGMLIGKHKMCPKISPNKTWEGAITGGIFGTLIASTFYYIVIDGNVNVLGLLVITLFLSCLGQLGDLFFSITKRNHNIKDFSNIMPGHGGVLDRLDSIIFVVIGYILLAGII
jgi:CDP-diglyceride synthetase